MGALRSYHETIAASERRSLLSPAGGERGMPRPLQRGGGRRVSDGEAADPSDSPTKSGAQKEGVQRARSVGNSVKMTSLLRFWHRRGSLPLGNDDDSSHGKVNLKLYVDEKGLRSEMKALPLQPIRLEPDGVSAPRSRTSSFLIFLNFGLVLVILLSLCGSFLWTLKMPRTPPSSNTDLYRGYRRLQQEIVQDFSDVGVLSLGLAKQRDLEFCPPELEDFVPCFNATVNPEEGSAEGRQHDRFCYPRSKENCLILPPKDYRVPLRWPTSRDVIWSMNVKITPEEVVSSGSFTKRMMMLEDNQISFRSDAVFVDEVEDYSHQIAEMIGLRNEDGFVNAGVRTVLDIGCGYGSFGAHLFSKQLLTTCIADYEASGSQVQLTLERGLPAIVASIDSKQLPFPFLSFDMVHCARCGVEWNQKGGAFLIEVDRVLKPGGYFFWTSSVTNTHRSARNKENVKKWKYIRNYAEKLCWDLLAQQEETAVWKKTSKRDCYTSRQPGTRPSICTKGHDIEYPYYRPLVSCIGGTQGRRWIPVEERTVWPLRATPNITELALHGLREADFDEDSISWRLMIQNYWSLLSPLIFSDHPKRPGDEDPSPPFNIVRNVMDMNARFGGFNAALLDAGKSVWVMNVVPIEKPSYLPLIFDRGFIGILHDWCEAFPTYPRTYDMLHADSLFSLEAVLQHRCTVFDIFLEMDRILRPEGWVVLRDKSSNIDIARSLVIQTKWDARVVELESNNDEKLLICQKQLIRMQP
ncbi:probable pectin methyltransferase QUA2 isoform X1 [Nymphaea colorata]|nr:probable pectin methyltransferase QUA2 isoform X1 [Nymphaea colorata]